MDKNFIPEPPKKQITIPAVDEQKIKLWVEFFKKISATRIKVLRTNEDEFIGFLDWAEKSLREKKTIESDYELIGWPDEKEIAFVIQVNSAKPNSIFNEYDIDNTYFFCFKDKAFRITHFQWDGDAEKYNWAKSFSLESYRPNCLSWNFILSLIIGRVRELEKQVPDPPKK